MEKLNLQCCRLLSNSGNFSNAGSQPVMKPEIKLPEHTSEHNNKSVQQPWTVFKDVYWI